MGRAIPHQSIIKKNTYRLVCSSVFWTHFLNWLSDGSSSLASNWHKLSQHNAGPQFGLETGHLWRTGPYQPHGPLQSTALLLRSMDILSFNQVTLLEEHLFPQYSWLGYHLGLPPLLGGNWSIRDPGTWDFYVTKSQGMTFPAVQ